jgi:hypothetical protein
MGILTEQQRARLPLANGIVRMLNIFMAAPHLRESDYEVPGCGGATWRDLHEVVTYAAGQFDRYG